MNTKYFNLRDKKNLSAADFTAAVSMLLRKEIIVLPTDTVYGFHSIVCDDLRQKINHIKNSPLDKPLIMLDLDFKPPIETDTPTTFLMENIAIRKPTDGIFAKILKAVGGRLYSTSVNLTGEPFMTDGKEIYEKFQGKISAVFDIGKIEAKSSRIISVKDGKIEVVRE